VALAGEDVDVGAGFRWPIVAPDWCFATETRGDIEPALIGPRRSQDEQITLTLSIGSWRQFDGDDLDDPTFTRAFQLLELVQRHIRTLDVTLGGAVLWCMAGSSSSDGATADDDTGAGRVTEITAEFICRHRITTL